MWLRDEPATVERLLRSPGAILFRGFEIITPALFGEVAREGCHGLIDYVYRSTPRTEVASQVYTATEYRADATIPFHNEESYQRDWPTRLAFCCLEPASTGGATPLASSGRVTRRLSADLVDEFEAKGVMYIRNYGHGVDLDWQTTFQTDSRQQGR